MKVKQGKSVIVLFLKIPIWINHINGELSTRLFIDMVVHRFIFNNNQITTNPFHLLT